MGGGVYPSIHWHTPPAQCMLSYTHTCPVHAGMHNSLAKTLSPRADTPRQTHPQADTPSPATTTAADGMHPTEMLSCLFYKCKWILFFIIYWIWKTKLSSCNYTATKKLFFTRYQVLKNDKIPQRLYTEFSFSRRSRGTGGRTQVS